MRNLSIAAVLCAALAIPASATVTTTASSVSYTGNGTTKAFTVPFKFLASTDLVVTVAGVGKSLNVDYTVKGAGNATGTVTFGTAPANAAAVVITRSIPLTQGSTVRQALPFPAGATIDTALDRQMMIAQQQAAKEAADLAVVNNAVAAFNSSGAAIGSTTSVLATGSTTPRTLAARAADSVNAKDFGAKGDGVTDDTAALQAALAAIGPSGTATTLDIPEGSYPVSSTLTLSGFVGARVKGHGNKTILKWAGNATGPMFSVSGTREATLADMRLQVASASFPIASMIVQEQPPLVNGLTSTMNTYRNLQIVGLGVMTQGIYIKGDVTDANNDFNNFLGLFINGYTEAGLLIQGANSFSNHIVNCQLGGGSSGQHYGIKSITGAGGESGHFSVHGGAALGHTIADVYVQTRSALPYIIDNLYSEGSVAYLVEDGAIGTATYTIIRGARFATANVGASPIISIGNPGPVLIENSNLGTDFTKAAKINWSYVVGFSPPSFRVINSRISGSLNTVAGVFTGTQPTAIEDTYWATSSTVSGLLRLSGIVTTTFATGSTTSLGAPAYSATATFFKTVATTAVQFGWANPTGMVAGQTITFQIKNASGGVLNAASPFQDTAFRAAPYTPPANGKNRIYRFFYDGTTFTEIRADADMSN